MKLYFTLLSFVMIATSSFSQKPCDFATDVTDSIGTYKVTKEYLIFEKNFAGKSSYIFNSIVLTDGTPTLSLQFLDKSFDFIKAKCFDKNSRLYFQLNDGKIVTLIHIDQEICGTMIRDEKGFNNRVLNGNFMFMKDNYEALKLSPISFMRIKFGAETEDYILRKEITSELDTLVYQPENYFIDYFHCLQNN
jgi:hypothetical protein